MICAVSDLHQVYVNELFQKRLCKLEERHNALEQRNYAVEQRNYTMEVRVKELLEGERMVKKWKGV